MTIPRWGVHHDIKFSPRRSILKVCPICKEFFLQVSKGNKRYCEELCAIKAKKEQMKIINQRIIKKRDNFEHAEDMRNRYANGDLSKEKWTVGTYNLPPMPLDNKGNPDYDKFHELLSKDKLKIGLI